VGLAETLTGQAAIACGHGRWKLRCPFHGGGAERTPSLVIYEPGRGWHCFGCGRGSDAVDFVSELKHVGSIEALLLVEELADTCPEAWSKVSS
jgi:DNA primase